MTNQNVRRLIFIRSVGIYEALLRMFLVPYRSVSDVIEMSRLDYTVLRPTWFSDTDEMDYETTTKGEPEKGSVISKKSFAALIADNIDNPSKFFRRSIGVNKPSS